MSYIASCIGFLIAAVMGISAFRTANRNYRIVYILFVILFILFGVFMLPASLTEVQR